MPCRSDYLEATGFELQMRETARVYNRARKLLKLKPDPQAGHDAANYYGGKDYTTDICALLSVLPADQLDALIYSNAKDKDQRAVATWWESHEAKDRDRVNAEMRKVKDAADRESAISKLTDYEKRLLGVEA